MKTLTETHPWIFFTCIFLNLKGFIEDLKDTQTPNQDRTINHRALAVRQHLFLFWKYKTKDFPKIYLADELFKISTETQNYMTPLFPILSSAQVKAEETFDMESGDLLSPETKMLIKGLGDTPESMALKASIIGAANELKRGDYIYISWGIECFSNICKNIRRCLNIMNWWYHDLFWTSCSTVANYMVESIIIKPRIHYQCIYHACSSFRYARSGWWAKCFQYTCCEM